MVLPFAGVNNVSSQPMQSKTIRAQLLSDMREGAYASCSRLPRESVLAEMLGISRTQLRDILASLEREGFITRRHGVGTVINRHVLNVRTRMDIEVEFLDMIRQSGHEAAVASVRANTCAADAHVAHQLGIPQGTPVLRVDRLCTAGGIPAIYCEDFIEVSRIQGEYTLQDLQQPIFHWRRMSKSPRSCRCPRALRCCSWTRWTSTLRASPFSVPGSTLPTGSSATPFCARNYNTGISSRLSALCL